MTPVEQFRKLFIASKTEKTIQFLKTLSYEDRRELRKELIKYYRIKHGFKESDREAYAAYHSFNLMDQHRIVGYGNMFCLGKDDRKYIEFMWRDLPEYDSMNAIFQETVPEDFPGLLAALLNEGITNFTYDQVMPWVKKGFLTGIEPYLATAMTGVFPRYTQTDDPVGFITERLEQYPEVLDEQVWYLFKYPNEVSYTDKLSTMKVDGRTGPWTYLLRTYSQNGRLDRMRLFLECVSATGLPFKKDQSHWYIDLFEGMEPTKKELLTLQDELFNSLSSPLSKMVNMSLSMMKKIAVEKEFRRDHFIQTAPMLLASDVKATVISTLAVLEIVAKTSKETCHAICISAATAFMSKDESVQTRAAKLIAKYGDLSAEELRNNLQGYADHMLMSVRPLLSFTGLPETESNEKTKDEILSTTGKVKNGMDSREKLSYITDTEELIFRLAQAISNFTSADFYLIPEALVRLNREIDEEILHKMAPVIQSARNRLGPWNPGRSLFIDYMCYFLFDYFRILFERFPSGDKAYAKTRAKSLEIIESEIKSRDNMDSNFAQPAFTGYRMLLDEYLEKVKTDDALPLLSTPTHMPVLLDPETLVSRLKQYQQAKREPGTMDMQQALQLCSLESPEKVLPVVSKELDGEYKELLTWYFDPNALLSPKRPHSAWWLTAAMMQTKREIPKELMKGFENIPEATLKGEFIAEPYVVETVPYNQYNPQTGKNEPFIRLDSRIKVGIQELYSKDTGDSMLFAAHSFSWCDRRLANTNGFMLSMPNNWQSHIAYLLDRVLQYASDTTDKHLIPILEVYRLAKLHLRNLDYTLFAYCMISNDKTVRAYIGETWAELVEEGLIDNHLLGLAVGAFEKVEYAPLKRFNELVEKNMTGLSSYHNQALENLLSACISQFPETPVANLKKLLEIYKEIVALNKSHILPATLPYLKAWENEANLKKVLKSLSVFM